MTVYEVVQGAAARPARALQAALLTALVVLALALVMAVRALREQARACPSSESRTSPQVQAMYDDELESSGYVMNVSRQWAHQREANERGSH